MPPPCVRSVCSGLAAFLQIAGRTGKNRDLQLLQECSIAGDKRFFLGACPPFKLPLPLQAVFSARMFFRVDEAHRAVLCGVSGGTSFIVPGNSTCDVISRSDVKRIIEATQYVDEPHRTTMPSSVSEWEGICPSTRFARSGHSTRPLACHERGREAAESNGGEGGIRTHVPVTRQDAFEAPPLRPLRYLSACVAGNPAKAGLHVVGARPCERASM
jgi:hypothetical protein